MLWDVIRIVSALLAIVAVIGIYLKITASVQEWSEGKSGRPWRTWREPRHEPAKVEIQSLFHGNTKDEDQL
jgi:hypothetical protein